MEASPPGRTSWWGMSAGGLHCHYCSHGIADVLWSACRWFFKKLPGSQMAAFWPFERTFKTSCDKMCPRNWNQPMQLLALHKSNPSLHLFRQQLLNHPSPACNKLRTPAPLERSKSPKQTQWLGGAVGIKFWDWGPLKSKQEAHIEAYSKTPTSDKIILKKLSTKMTPSNIIHKSYALICLVGHKNHIFMTCPPWRGSPFPSWRGCQAGLPLRMASAASNGAGAAGAW